MYRAPAAPPGVPCLPESHPGFSHGGYFYLEVPGAPGDKPHLLSAVRGLCVHGVYCHRLSPRPRLHQHQGGRERAQGEW